MAKTQIQQMVMGNLSEVSPKNKENDLQQHQQQLENKQTTPPNDGRCNINKTLYEEINHQLMKHILSRMTLGVTVAGLFGFGCASVFNFVLMRPLYPCRYEGMRLCLCFPT